MAKLNGKGARSPFSYFANRPVASKFSGIDIVTRLRRNTAALPTSMSQQLRDVALDLFAGLGTVDIL